MAGLHHIGTAPDGSPILQARLHHDGVRVELISLGCATMGWHVPLGAGQVNVLLGYRDPAHYGPNRAYLGVIAGRIANRTAQARFALAGKTYRLEANAPPHHLHGGRFGTSHRNWRLEPAGAQAVRAHCRIGHLEDGCPGSVEITAHIRLGADGLTYALSATPDRPSPINLAQHNYYNLMGSGTIWEHTARIAARRYTPTDTTLIPTGGIAAVAGGQFDFTRARRFGAADPAHQGTDINLVLDTAEAGRPAAEIRAPNGLRLQLWTDQPGLQLYTGGNLPDDPGQGLRPFGGLCLEPQGFPDALNQPAFPAIICTPDRPYRQTTRIRISP